MNLGQFSPMSDFFRRRIAHNCPIFDYTRDGLIELFTGFANVEIRRGKSGFLLRANA